MTEKKTGQCGSVQKGKQCGGGGNQKGSCGCKDSGQCGTKGGTKQGTQKKQ